MSNRVINAAGKMSALGGSASAIQVATAMFEASQRFYVMDELVQKLSEEIAKQTGAEAGLPTSSASAGIALSVAGVCCEDNLIAIENLPFGNSSKEIIIQKGHVISFGCPITQLIRLGGGTPIEVGTATNVQREHIEDAISENTVALVYVQSHHSVQKGMVALSEYIEIGHKNQLPVIVDAAAEQNLEKYIQAGADLVIYSGSKAIGGPASGIIAGKKVLIQKCNNNYRGIGRPMKVGKETMMGLLVALKSYNEIPQNLEDQKVILEPIRQQITQLNKKAGITFEYGNDEAGRPIIRGIIYVNKNLSSHSIFELIELLETGNTKIFTRNHTAGQGYVQVDPRTLLKGDEIIIANRLKEIFTKWKLNQLHVLKKLINILGMRSDFISNIFI